MAKSEIDEIGIDIENESFDVFVDLSVDINNNNITDIEVDVSANGINTAIFESQIVPYEDVLNITDFSPEATMEERYASSAYSSKKIHDFVSEIENRVEIIEGYIRDNPGGSEGGNDNPGISSDLFEFDASANMIKAKYGLYSVGAISAGGKSGGSNTGTSGGITQDELDNTLKSYATKTWVTNQNYASNSSLSSLEDRVANLEENGGNVSEDLLEEYAKKEWVNQGFATLDSMTAIEERVTNLEENGGGGGDDAGGITAEELERIYSRLTELEKILTWFEFDDVAQMIKAKHGLYSVGAITAGKQG